MKKTMMVLELWKRERYLYYEVDNGGGIYIKMYNVVSNLYMYFFKKC